MNKNRLDIILLESSVFSSVIVIAAHSGQKSDEGSVVEAVGEGLVEVVLPSLPGPGHAVIV